jgi:hypothetical protein
MLMVLNTLKLYDLIVDIIPGFIIILMSYPLLPESWIQSIPLLDSQFFSGIALVAASYPAGRILYGIASMLGNSLIWLRIEIVSMLVWGTILIANWGGVGSNTVVRQIDRVIEKLRFSGIYTLSDYVIQYYSHDKGNQLLIKNIEVSENILEQVVELLNDEINIDLRIENYAETKALTKYGKHILYSKDTLYRNYEILNSFYKSITTGFLLVGILYIVVATDGLAQIEALAKSQTGKIGVALIGVSFLCYFRQIKWKERMHRAFFNDLHQDLYDDLSK